MSPLKNIYLQLATISYNGGSATRQSSIYATTVCDVHNGDNHPAAVYVKDV